MIETPCPTPREHNVAAATFSRYIDGQLCVGVVLIFGVSQHTVWRYQSQRSTVDTVKIAYDEIGAQTRREAGVQAGVRRDDEIRSRRKNVQEFR